jgi:hypothetical protein
MSIDGYSFIEGEEGELDKLADLTPNKSQESLSVSQNTSQKEYVYLYDKLERNWNEEFQSLFDQTLSDSRQEMERVQQLRALCEEFAEEATRIGKTIISELFLPTEKKTIPSITGLIGGVAGGSKYFHGSIFFKFPTDEMNLYGGEEGLMKASGHELKGLMCYIDCRIQKLHFPLMVVIDYKGWRLLAASVLPVSKDTIIYGTCDGARTILTDSDEFNKKMELAAKILNLKGEHVWNQDKTSKSYLHACCDVEGHLGKDNRFYIVDTARVLPPTKPVKGLQGCFLYRIMRPELVKSNPVPLCPDSYSGFNLENKQAHNFEIKESTQRLETEIIPKFAASLDDAHIASLTKKRPRESSQEDFSEDSEKQPEKRRKLDANKKVLIKTNSNLIEINTETEPKNDTFERLIVDMHRNGINMRYLGQVRYHVKSEHLKKLLMTEMVARAVKHHIRKQMREYSKAPSKSRVKSFNEIVMNTLNLLFGSASKSFSFWSTEVKQSFDYRFPDWDKDNTDKNKNLKHQCVYLQSLFERLPKIAGFELHADAVARITSDWKTVLTSEKFIGLNEVTNVFAIVKHIHRIFFEEGTAFSRLALSSETKEEKDQLLDLAGQSFQESIRVRPNDYRSLHNHAYSLYLKAMNRISGDRKLLTQAAELFEEAVTIEPNDFKSLYKWANCLFQLSKLEKNRDKAFEFLERAFVKYKQAHDLRKEEWKVLYHWGIASLERPNLLAKFKNWKPLRNSHKPNTNNNNTNLNGNPPSDDFSLQSSDNNLTNEAGDKEVYLGSYNEACQKFEQAYTLSQNSPDVLLNWASALSKKARVLPNSLPDYYAQVDATFVLAFQKFQLAATQQPQSSEVFFNWGNSYYRQAEMKIQQNKSRDEDNSTPRVSKSEVNTLLSNSARKYNHVLQHNHENKQALQNWVKVLQFMETVEKTFEIDISNNLLSQPEMNPSKDGDDDEESTASVESLSDTDPNIYSEVIFKKSNSKTGSGGLLAEDDEADEEPVPLLDSFLVLEVKLFLSTFQTLFMKHPKYAPLQLLLDLVSLDNVEINDQIYLTLKELRPLIEEDSFSANSPPTGSQKDLFKRLWSAVEKTQQELTKAVPSFPMPPSRSGSFTNLKFNMSDFHPYERKEEKPMSIFNIMTASTSSNNSLKREDSDASNNSRNGMNESGSFSLNSLLQRGFSKLDSTIPIDYDLVEMLETEGSSMVARVKKKDIKKQFALKIVPRAMKGSQYLKETESKVFQELPQHPFIISRENYFMNDKYHYFLSEFVESKNLDQCLVSRIHERCKFDEQTVRFWAAEMALGIHHLHENSLAFQGNLRPTKVLVDKEGHIHLILPLSPSAPISFEQYSQYLPPEILEGRSDIGKESDWWSFGVLLYLMLAGKSPFAASKINQTVQNVLSEEVKLPDDLSLESKDLLFSLLTKDLTYRMIDYGKIKSHPFFKGIDWERIGRKQLQGPYKPSFNAKVRAPTPVPEINDTIVVSNYNADEFMGYTFAESRERKK